MGIVIIQENKIRYLNKFSADILGYTRDEMYNWGFRNIKTAIHPDYREIVLDQLMKK